MLGTLIDFLLILNRYVHIICTTVIVGGTLFFELIVPVATGELKHEQQMLVFGRARWSFRTLVWGCAILLVITGIVSSVRRWNDYAVDDRPAAQTADRGGEVRNFASDLRRPGWWWAAHASAGMVALIVAASLMTVRRPPDYPLYWMRLSLMILLVVIFFATTSRHLRLSAYEAEQATPKNHAPE